MIPNPSGFSKMIGSLRPLLWMNSYVKSSTKQADNNMPVYSHHHTTGFCCHSAFIHVHEYAYIKCHQIHLTFSLHVIDQLRTEPLTVDFLLQVKRPPAVNLFVRDAIVMVMSPGTSPLLNENEGHNLSSHPLTYSFHRSFLRVVGVLFLSSCCWTRDWTSQTPMFLHYNRCSPLPWRKLLFASSSFLKAQ